MRQETFCDVSTYLSQSLPKSHDQDFTPDVSQVQTKHSVEIM